MGYKNSNLFTTLATSKYDQESNTLNMVLMKQNRLLLLLSACLCTIIACRKEDDKVVISSQLLVGVWELRAAGGGWEPYHTIPAGNGHILKFTQDAYEYDSVGKLISSGSYRIVKDTPMVVSGTTDRIIYENSLNDLHTYIALSGDTLSYMLDAYDAGGATYIRINNKPGTMLSSNNVSLSGEIGTFAR